MNDRLAPEARLWSWTLSAPLAKRAPAPTVFDTIQKSNRHKSGFPLRFPRIVRLRPDKTPADATTLDEVRELYASIVGATRP